MKALARLLRALLLLLLAAALVFFAVYGARGWQLYRAAMEEEPLEARIEAVEQRADFVPFDELPALYVDAVTSVEDKRFFSHPGVDPIAIGRALLYDLRTRSFAQGGSTITQQVVKNLCFTQEKTLERKAAEVFAALSLERLRSKEEIFALYVNGSYFGSGCTGVAAAAQAYFGKEVVALDAAECVLLAGIPNAPSAYSPQADPELTAARARQVLRRMTACKVLSEEDAQALEDQIARRLGLQN